MAKKAFPAANPRGLLSLPSMSATLPMLSVVFPLYNEEELIDYRLTTLDSMEVDFKISCVDDVSRDQIWFRLLAMRAQYLHLKALVRSLIFNHQRAYMVGLHAAKGICGAIKDSDLQGPPKVLPQLRQLLQTHACDIAHEQRSNRAEDWGHRVLIRSFCGILPNFFKLRVAGNVGNLPTLIRKVLAISLVLEGKNRYLPGLQSLVSFRKTGVVYFRDRRLDSTLSGISYGRLFSPDVPFAFSVLLIEACLYSGPFSIIVLMLDFMYVWDSKRLDKVTLDRTSLGMSILSSGYF